jgi:hypothetical protein
MGLYALELRVHREEHPTADSCPQWDDWDRAGHLQPFELDLFSLVSSLPFTVDVTFFFSSPLGFRISALIMPADKFPTRHPD